MAAAIIAARDLDPEACRHAARTRFSLDRMVDGYIQAYQELAALGNMHASWRRRVS
jgi:hypothetical protein